MSLGSWHVASESKLSLILTKIMRSSTPPVQMMIPSVVSFELEHLKSSPSTRQKGLAPRLFYEGLLNIKYRDIVHVEPREKNFHNMGAYRSLFDVNGAMSFTTLYGMFNDLCVEQLCFQLKFLGHSVVLFTRDVLMQFDCRARGIGHVHQEEMQRFFNKEGNTSEKERAHWTSFLQPRPSSLNF